MIVIEMNNFKRSCRPPRLENGTNFGQRNIVYQIFNGMLKIV